MSAALQVAHFEPVVIEPDGPLIPTEYGKRWIADRIAACDQHRAVMRDVVREALVQRQKWDQIERALVDEGVPTAITNGVSQYGMSHLVDHLNGKTAFTMPAVVAIALATAAPTSTTTGATLTEATYTGYARVTIAAAGWNAATAATPSVATNASAITFGNCTGGSNTLAGFLIADSATLAAGNALWYGTLTSVTISTTQTPPQIAAGSLSTSLTGT